MSLIPKEEVKSKLVPPEGDLSANYVLVGEAPGAEEDKLKRPFVGYSGHLLMDLLDNVGIMRKHCYLTNVIKEQPKRNDISLFIKFKRSSGVQEAILTSSAREYLAQLKEELSQTTANVIVAVGNIALWALTGKNGITNYRGSVLESTLLPGRKVIPIIHPAAALRLFIYQRYILLDLFKVTRESEYPEIRLKERKLKIFPTYQESISYLREASKLTNIRIGGDIETNRITREISHFSFALNDTEAISIQFFKNGKNFFTLEEEANIWHLIGKLMENPEITKIFQNAAFDAWFNFKRYGIIIRPIVDTMIAMAFAFPDFNKGLDFLCSVYTDIPYYKGEGKDHTGQKTEQDEIEYAQYSARDSVVLPEIMSCLEEDLKKQKNWDYFLNHCKLIEPLTYMQERGISVDIKGIEEEKVRTQTRLREIEEEWKKVTGSESSLGSTKQLQAYFYIELGITPFKKPSVRKDGEKISSDTLDEKALQRIAVGTKTRKPRPEAFLVLEHRKLSKLDSTYYDLADFDEDSRMRCAYKPVGTRFSRLSSTENIFGTGMNMQNQPHSMKKFFLADPGYMIFDVDLSQADWRVVAYLAMDYNMISTLESGKDIHTKTASGIFLCRPEEVSNEDGSAPNFGNGTHSQRFWGKKSNHSLNYDASANELALQLFIPMHQAKELRAKYLNIYPGVANTFWSGIKRKIDQDRTVTNLFGRSYTFRDRLQEVYKPAYAYIPQSTVADIINQWGLVRMYYDQEVFKNFELLLQIHDSIVFQVKIRDNFKEIAEGLRILKGSLEQPLHYRNQTFNIPCEMVCGKHYLHEKDDKHPLGVEKITVDETLEDQLKTIWEK